MKFIPPSDGKGPQLSQEVLDSGIGLQLVHRTQASSGGGAAEKAFWDNNLEPLDAIRILKNHEAYSVLQSRPEDFQDDVRAWVSLREKTHLYFSDPLKCLLPDGEAFQYHLIKSPEEKEQVRLRIADYAIRFGNQGCQEAVEAVFQELFMNAILDAPGEGRGRLFSSTNVVFYLAHDARRLGVACRDGYGSLKMEKLLNRLAEVYEKGAGEAINLRERGGAGIGCTIMIEKSAVITFGVQPGRATTVSCLIYRHMSNKTRTGLKKTVHLIQND